MKQQQHGIALLTALLIMAIAVMIAGSVIATQHYDIRLVANIQNLERGYQYVNGIEQTAGIWLRRDQEDNNYDSTSDLWAQDIPPLPIAENGTTIGFVSGKITDATAFLNLNNLIDTEGNTDNNALQHLTTLLDIHAIPNTFANNVLDWIDADNNRSAPDSAESDYYLTGEYPYLAANNLLVDKSELFLLKLGYTLDPKERKEQLTPFMEDVIALPNPSKINVNTASGNVLAAIGLEDEWLEEILSTRDDSPYTPDTLSALKQRYLSRLAEAEAVVESDDLPEISPDNSADNKDPIWDYVDAQSQYFQLKGVVSIGTARLFFKSVLERNEAGGIRVIMRQFEYATQQNNEKT